MVTQQMYLTQEDYKPVCSSRELEILQQSDSETRERAERTALEEVASYLRSRFDIKTEFERQGLERNAHLVQICVNITLYYLMQWLPGKMASETRTASYENAINWLEKVQAGKASPDLPGYDNETGGNDNVSGTFPMMYGSMKKNKYDW